MGKAPVSWLVCWLVSWVERASLQSVNRLTTDFPNYAAANSYTVHVITPFSVSTSFAQTIFVRNARWRISHWRRYKLDAITDLAVDGRLSESN